MNKADVNKMGYVITSTRDSDSWFTPQKYIESVRNTLGSINLDPFSSEEANKNIAADIYYTANQDSLSFNWDKVNSCFANPPYSKGLILKCITKVIYEIDKGNIHDCIVLVNASTDTKWFHLLINNSSAMCLTLGRISFENIDGKNISGNTKGQCFFLLSKNANMIDTFTKEFSKYGAVLYL